MIEVARACKMLSEAITTRPRNNPRKSSHKGETLYLPAPATTENHCFDRDPATWENPATTPATEKPAVKFVSYFDKLYRQA